MQIIPVMDLYQGRVVHARLGVRERYRPLQSVLLAGNAPEAVLAAVLALWPFKLIYIADLDAIRREGSNQKQIAGLVEGFPKLRFWLDAGVDAAGHYPAHAIRPGIAPVLGTENDPDAACLSLLHAHPNSVLSLDIQDARQATPWLRHCEDWPQEIIVMTLYRVGGLRGPDHARLEAVRRRAGGHRRVYAAGGVRNTADLRRLAAQGISGVLLASALHNGNLGREALATAMHCPPGTPGA